MTDRSNMSSANSANFLQDNHMTKKDFNDGQTIFYCSFLFAELPGQIISKRVGPDRFVPFQMVCWGIVTWAHFWINGRTSFFVLRALLGICQGSFIPDLRMCHDLNSAQLSIGRPFRRTERKVGGEGEVGLRLPC